MKKFLSLSLATFLFTSLFISLSIIVSAPLSFASESSEGEGIYKTLDDLKGARIGVQQGSFYADLVNERIEDANISYFISLVDELNALKAGKIDAFVAEEPTLNAMSEGDDSFTFVPEYLEEEYYGCAFPKTDASKALNAQISEYIARIKEDGTLDQINDAWFGEDETLQIIPDYDTLPATNGILKVATEPEYPPFEYIRDGQVVGFDFDIVYRFCLEYGYGLDIQMMSFDGILPAVQSGKCDFAISALGITDERKESVDFSESYYVSRSVLVVLKKEKGTTSFLSSVVAGFDKTFFRENRYMLFIQGAGTTLLITLSSILFGTILGFIVYMLCRKGNVVANMITGICVYLVQGMPVVVLLMILYYVIFAKSRISGVSVSIIAFTLVFAASVYSMIRMGVGAVDKGQTEASYALGYSDISTFFKIVLPQAIPHFLPSYKGEVISLIKATAIVGYVAVQDLTKMGDIIRGRTYDAFFPLIAVAVIYFILGGLLTLIVGRIETDVDPKRRNKDKILKGVKTDD